MIDKVVRDRLRPPDGQPWTQPPELLRQYAEAKAARDITKLPIGERYEERLSRVRAWAEQYRGVQFWIATNPHSYIDDFTSTEEPEFYNLKWRKKTWDGMYPNKGKSSDIDLNPKWNIDNQEWLDEGACRALLLGDSHWASWHLVDLGPDLRVDVYHHKNEQGVWL